jgi:hypothetical protein
VKKAKGNLKLSNRARDRLIQLSRALINQKKARILIEAQKKRSGYWFGGGNLVCDRLGRFYISGRYRNKGDSRTGTGAGARGLEMAIFKADNFKGPYKKVLSFSKKDLRMGRTGIVSIEGVSLQPVMGGYELFISTEKAISYPRQFKAFQKPQTGVWSIDSIPADQVHGLSPANLKPVIASSDPGTLHVKDPVSFLLPRGGLGLFYCNHPINWSCSNTGFLIRRSGKQRFEHLAASVLERGNIWDVAMTRITERMPVPRFGLFKHLPPLSLYFYDGGECVRKLEENKKAVKRPRGYSCEELGGVAWGWDSRLPEMHRLSEIHPLFVSPYGTGCSRYVSTVVTRDAICATWQQSQDNLSQPLVGHSLTIKEVEQILK